VEVPSGERRRLLTAELQDAQSRSRLGTFQLDTANLQDYDQSVHARIVFDVQGHFSEDTDHSGSLEGSVSDSTIWAKLLALNLDYDRQLPLELPVPFESIHRYSVQLPPGYRLESLPSEQLIVSRWGFFRLSVKPNEDDPQHFELVYQTRVDQVRVEPADFEEFRKFREDVARSYRTWLTLKPVEDKAARPAVQSPAAAGVR
jgi:hypothetical protein